MGMFKEPHWQPGETSMLTDLEINFNLVGYVPRFQVVKTLHIYMLSYLHSLLHWHTDAYAGSRSNANNLLPNSINLLNTELVEKYISG